MANLEAVLERTERDPAERFWIKVNEDGPVPAHRPELGQCWEWTASLGSGGYGQFQMGGRGGKMHKAHRVAWQKVNGDIPEGLSVLHFCDNRKCVRPAHLWLGTYTDNNRDMAAKGRHIGSRKLTPEQVIDIRRPGKGRRQDFRVSRPVQGV